MTHHLNRWLLVLVLFIALPFWWLLVENNPGTAAPHPIHIAQLRMLAASLPGPHPSAVEVEILATRLAPGTYFAAGVGLKRRPLAAAAYRLPVPGGRPIMIDSGMTAPQAAAINFDHYDARVRQRIDAALDEAGLILATSELSEHLGGLVVRAARPGGRKVLAHAMLAPAQVLAPAHGSLPWSLPWPQAAQPVPAPANPAPHAVAPGVVVIPAPGQSPGAQMIFVTLADGREYLFAGDTATVEANWQQIRGRSRLLSNWLGREDRGAVYAWLLTIRRLKQEAPRLLVVPGHDFDWLWFQASHHNVVEGFHPGRSR